MLSTRVTILAKTLRALSVRDKINLCGLFSLYSAYLFALLLVVVRAQTGINNKADQQLYFGAWLMVLPISLILTAIHGMLVHRITRLDSQWRSYLYRVPVTYNAVYLVVMFLLLTYSNNSMSLVYYVLIWFPIFHTVISGFVWWASLTQIKFDRSLLLLLLGMSLLFGIGYGFLSIQHDAINQDGTSVNFQVYPIYDRQTECFNVTWQSDNVKDLRFNGASPDFENYQHACGAETNQFTVLTAEDEWVRIHLLPTTAIFAEIIICIFALVVLSYWGYGNFIGLALIVFSGIVCLMFNIDVYAILTVGLLTLILLWLSNIQWSVKDMVIHISVIVLIALFTINLDFAHDRWHYNTWLSTINDILHGKTILVDTLNQHGVLSLYFQALIFSTNTLPLSYTGFALLINLFVVLNLVLCYFVVKFVTNSFSMAIAVTLLFSFIFASYSEWRHTIFPSLGVLRFGMVYILAFVIVLRYRWYPDHRLAYIPELTIIGLSAFWSIFIAVYIIIAYLALMGYEFIAISTTPRQFFVRLLRHILVMLVPIAIVGVIVHLFTFLRAGTLPNWDLYLTYFRSFSTSISTYQTPIFQWHLEFMVLVIEYLTVAGILMRTSVSHPKQWQSTAIITLLVTAGIIQMFFYIQLSVSGHFIMLLFPGVIAGVYWITRYQHIVIWESITVSVVQRVAWAGLIVLFIGMGASDIQHYIFPGAVMPASIMTPFRLLVDSIWHGNRTDTLSTLAYVQDRWHMETGEFYGLLGPHELEYESVFTQQSDLVYSGQPIIHDPFVIDAVGLINKYTPDDERIGLFIPSESFVHTMITKGTVHDYPIADPSGQIYNRASLQMIEETPLPYAVGDILYVIDDLSLLRVRHALEGQTYFSYMKDIVLETCQAFSFRLLDTTPSGVVAMELIEHQANRPCGDDHLAFAEIQVDVGDSLNPDMFVSGWQLPEQWQPETIRWMQKDANIEMPACVDTPTVMTMRVFNPAETEIHLTIASGTFTQETPLSAGWGEYTFEVDESLCTVTNKTAVALSTDYQIPLETDPRGLSIAVDAITIKSYP